MFARLRLKTLMMLVGLGTAVLVAACSGQTTPVAKNTSTTATLNASASCGTTDADCYWDWGYRRHPSGAWSYTPIQGPVGAESATVNVSANVTGLTPGTTYDVELCGDGGRTGTTTPTQSSLVCVGDDGRQFASDNSNATEFTTSAASSGGYTKPPADQTSGHWYWQISNPLTTSQLNTAPVSTANIIDTDYFLDANSLNGQNQASGTSSIVSAIKAKGAYPVCYVEAGAYQTGFPDDSDFAAADYGSGAKQYQMQGYSNEWWFDLRGFAGYTRGATLTGAAANIALGLSKRIAGCATEGQRALEPDDLDGYTNDSASGASGGGWGLTRADSEGFEEWLAYTAHDDGLAIFQKNDTENIPYVDSAFDGAISEECNAYDDPCTEWNPYTSAGKPVLNAEYTQDGETTAKFCSTDATDKIAGALFSVNLDSPSSYTPCRTN